jgi:hypothetical protein
LTTLFVLADAVLFRMLPVKEPHRLVEITRVGGGSISLLVQLAETEGLALFFEA